MRGPLAIWDVDGTLVDSRASIQEAMTHAFEAARLPPPPYDATRRIVGLSLSPALAALAPELDAGALDGLADAYRQAWLDMHDAPGFSEPLYPGAQACLERLARDGWRLSMATGKSRRGVERALGMHGWSDLFLSTHCADDGPGKPDPAMVLAALDAAGARPSAAVMIGDTAFDMAMARAAGVRAVGVSWGFHTAEEVRAGGADVVVEDFAALERALAALRPSLAAAAAPN